MFVSHLLFAYNVFLMTLAPHGETMKYERAPVVSA